MIDDSLKILVTDFILESQERLDRIEEEILKLETKDICQSDEDINLPKKSSKQDEFKNFGVLKTYLCLK